MIESTMFCRNEAVPSSCVEIFFFLISLVYIKRRNNEEQIAKR